LVYYKTVTEDSRVESIATDISTAYLSQYTFHSLKLPRLIDLGLARQSIKKKFQPPLEPVDSFVTAKYTAVFCILFIEPAPVRIANKTSPP
jgi:hypothetical protein